MEFSDIEGRYKKVEGFEDYYITEFGEVYSTRPLGASKEHKLRKLKPAEPGRKEKYLNVKFHENGYKKTEMVHRLVAKHFVDGYFEGAVVNHIDGNNRNNRADNLEWTTVRDNIYCSYKNSGIGATRNYKLWELISPDGESLGVFIGNKNLQKFVIENNLDTSPSFLVKSGESRGYTVKKRDKSEGNCNDYPI